VQRLPIAQLEEGDELIMTVEVLEPEPMKIRKTTIAQQMADKSHDGTKSTPKNQSPRLSGDTGTISPNKEARQLPPSTLDHKIKLTPNAPNVINSKVYPSHQ